jgi:TonB family protein
MILAAMLSLVVAQAASPSPMAPACLAGVHLLKAEYPTDFEPPGERGALAATVVVTVGPDGKVEKASIFKSSGDFSFDMASIRAAKSSTYTPELVDCKPIEGTYLFKTSLTPGGPPP